MSGRYNLKIISLILVLKLSTVECCFSQNSSLEFWPETDIWYRLNPSWRLSSFIPITKYYESKNRDMNIYLQADFAWGKTKHLLNMRLMDENKVQQIKGWLVRGGYMKGWSLGDNAGDYIEDMLFAEIHRRSPLKGNMLFSSRFRTDLRWLGEDPVFSYRFRLRWMIEKEFKAGRGSIVPYLNAEPFWDSRYSTFNRVRVIGGATAGWGKRFAYEGNLTYQYDEQYNFPNLYAINIILHMFFETKHASSKNSK
jgi:hypothetical protein